MIFYIIALSMTSIWLSSSMIIDFLVAPQLFAHINDFFLGGKIAAGIFGIYNWIELILGNVLLMCTTQFKFRNKNYYFLAGIGLLLLFITVSYLILTPKIASLANSWEAADKVGKLGNTQISDLQQAHQFYHRIYVSLDVVKMLLLVGYIFLVSKRIYVFKK